MKLKLLAAVSAIALLPTIAIAQPKAPAAPKPTVADVQKVAKMIQTDKAKTAAYCQLAKLEEDMSKAEEAKDNKKVEELGKKADALAAKLGPDYAKLMAGLETVEPESADGKKLAAAFEQLEKLCSR